MKRYLQGPFVVLLALSLALPLLEAADSPKTITAKVSEIVPRFPGQTTAEKDALAAELIALGPEGVMAICRMLAPPGAADDSKARFALNGLATYASSSRLEQQRKMLVRSLAKALEKETSKDVQAFLISQLQLAGKAESVKPLRKYLLDRELGEPATRALLAIKTPEAEKAVLKALGAAPGPNKVTLIKALGDFQTRKATKILLPYAGSQDANIRQAALYALANSGDPLAEGALNKTFLEASHLERTQAPSLYLLYARRLAEAGGKTQAAKICRTLIKNYTAPKETHVSCAALTLLTDVMGKNAFADIMDALDSGHQDVRGKALELANRFEGQDVTARLIEKMSGAAPETQAQIIFALGLRGDSTAILAVREKLESRDKPVCLAAIPAAARLGGSELIPDLFAFMRSEDSEEIQAAERALMGFSKDMVVPRALGILDQAPPPAQAALIRILAGRGAVEHVDLILAKAKSEDETIRTAALTALEPLVGEKDLPRLIALLLETTASRETMLIQKAIVAGANQIADPENRSAVILEAMADAPGEKRAVLLAPLPKIGGTKALEAVTAQTRSKDLRVQTAAMYALSQWSDFRAAEPLLAICRTTASRKFLNLALQGFVRLVSAEELSFKEKIRLLSEALAIPSEPAEKKLVLAGLARVKTLDSFRLVAANLDDPNLNKEAARAAASIALPSPGHDDGLGSVEVIRALRNASCLIQDENLRKQVDDYIAALLRNEGFRPLFNGRNLAGWKGLVGDPPSRAKMTARELEKAQAEADAAMHIHWKAVDGILVLDGSGQSLCTDKDFGDFELFVDWKIEEKGDSGIYLRGSPQVQIWDPAQWPEGSGGLYNNQKGPNKPLKRADNPVGAWNTFFIRMSGERVTVYLNNVLVVDNVVMENYWEREKPIYPSGQVELQAHSTPLYFRNIYIRELKP
jgi:HEAT repeat protein